MNEKPDVSDEHDLPDPPETGLFQLDDLDGPGAPLTHDEDVAEAIDATIMGDEDDDEPAVPGDDGGLAAADASAQGEIEPEAVVPPPDDQLIAIVEVLIFASPDPITLKALTKLLEPEPASRIEAAIELLKARYDDARGLTGRRGGQRLPDRHAAGAARSGCDWAVPRAHDAEAVGRCPRDACRDRLRQAAGDGG